MKPTSCAGCVYFWKAKTSPRIGLCKRFTPPLTARAGDRACGMGKAPEDGQEKLL